MYLPHFNHIHQVFFAAAHQPGEYFRNLQKSQSFNAGTSSLNGKVLQFACTEAQNLSKHTLSMKTRFPMIILHPRVTMATALAQSSLLPSESNPAQIRYKHQTEELNPPWISSQKQKASCSFISRSHSYDVGVRFHHVQTTTAWTLTAE